MAKGGNCGLSYRRYPGDLERTLKSYLMAYKVIPETNNYVVNKKELPLFKELINAVHDKYRELGFKGNLITLTENGGVKYNRELIAQIDYQDMLSQQPNFTYPEAINEEGDSDTTQVTEIGENVLDTLADQMEFENMQERFEQRSLKEESLPVVKPTPKLIKFEDLNKSNTNLDSLEKINEQLSEIEKTVQITPKAIESLKKYAKTFEYPILVIKGMDGKVRSDGEKVTVHDVTNAIWGSQSLRDAQTYARVTGRIGLYIVEGKDSKSIKVPTDLKGKEYRAEESRLIEETPSDIVILDTIDGTTKKPHIIMKGGYLPIAIISPEGLIEESDLAIPESQTSELSEDTEKKIDNEGQILESWANSDELKNIVSHLMYAKYRNETGTKTKMGSFEDIEGLQKYLDKIGKQRKEVSVAEEQVTEQETPSLELFTRQENKNIVKKTLAFLSNLGNRKELNKEIDNCL